MSAPTGDGAPSSIGSVHSCRSPQRSDARPMPRMRHAPRWHGRFRRGGRARPDHSGVRVHREPGDRVHRRTRREPRRRKSAPPPPRRPPLGGPIDLHRDPGDRHRARRPAHRLRRHRRPHPDNPDLEALLRSPTDRPLTELVLVGLPPAAVADMAAAVLVGNRQPGCCANSGERREPLLRPRGDRCLRATRAWRTSTPTATRSSASV